MTRRYYLMGVVGVGKSTLRENLRQRFPEASVYEEWPESLPPGGLHALGALDDRRVQDIQTWIFTQLARKNALVSADKAPMAIIDRSPLDTFAFYEQSLWSERANQLLSALRHHDPELPLAPGQLIFLRGDPQEIASRMDPVRGYTTDRVAAQQAAFDHLTACLRPQGINIRTIDTQGLTPQEVADRTEGYLINAPYHPANIQGAVEKLSAAL